MREETNVRPITASCVSPVFHTMATWTGLSVRTPTTIKSPARAGKAISPTYRPRSRIAEAITIPAVRLANRERAPALVTSAVADKEPATAVPWKSPETRLAAPWPTKSPEGFG
jgi:hypothetical protein